MRSRLCMTMAILLLVGANAFGQTTEVLKLIPEDALGFIVVNRPEQTEKQIAALAKKIGMPLPVSPLEQIKQMTGITKGINEKGTAAIVLFENPQGALPQVPPDVVAIIPVTNYQDLLQSLNAKEGPNQIAKFQHASGADILIAQPKSFRGNFALAAMSEQQAALEKMLQAKNNATAALQPIQKWLIEVDTAAVALAPGVKTAADTMVQSMETMKLFLDPTNDEQKLALQMIDVYGKGIKSFGENVSYFALGARLKMEGNVSLSLRGGFAKDSSYAKAAQDYPTVDGGPLAGLPGGPFVVAFGAIMPESYREGMIELAKLGMQIGADKLTDKEKQAVGEIFSKLYSLRSISAVIGSSAKGDSGIMGSVVSILKVPDARQYLEIYEKNAVKLDELTRKANPQSPTKVVSVKRAEASEVPAVEVVQKLEANQPEEQQVFEAMFGKTDKIISTLAAVDDKTVLIAMTPAKDIRRFVQAYRSNEGRLAADPDVQKLAAALPSGAQWIVLVDFDTLPKYISQLAGQFAPNMPKMPEFPASPPAGFGLKISPAGMEGELVLPIPLLENGAAFIRKMQALQGV